MKSFFNFIRENIGWILKVSFAIFIIYYLVFFLTPSVDMTLEQKYKLDSLNQQIQKLHEDNKTLEMKIGEYENIIREVDFNLDRIKGEKTIIKEIYHEKINNVDKLSIPELDSFFTDRYK